VKVRFEKTRMCGYTRLVALKKESDSESNRSKPRRPLEWWKQRLVAASSNHHTMVEYKKKHLYNLHRTATTVSATANTHTRRATDASSPNMIHDLGLLPLRCHIHGAKERTIHSSGGRISPALFCYQCNSSMMVVIIYHHPAIRNKDHKEIHNWCARLCFSRVS